MRWSRHVLLVLLLLGLVAAGLGAYYGMPIWGIQWLPWVAGCFLLRRGKVLGAVLLLSTSAALVFMGWGTKVLLLRFSDGPEWLVLWRHPYPWIVAFLGLAGVVATLTVTRPLWRVDALATLVLLVVTVGVGLGGALAYGAVPRFHRCPRGVVEIGPVLHAWHWLHQLRRPYSLAGRVAGGKAILWMQSGRGTYCMERPADGTGPYQVWKVFSSYENGRRHVDDRLVRMRGVRSAQGYLLEHKMHGKWISWFDTGMTDGGVEATGELHKGQKVGRWTTWHKNGRKMRQGNYRNGKRDGLWSCWWPNGQLLGQGEPLDAWSFWDRDGNPVPYDGRRREQCRHHWETSPDLW